MKKKKQCKLTKIFKATLKRVAFSWKPGALLPDVSMSGHTCSTIRDSDVNLNPKKKTKSERNLFKIYLRSMKTQTELAEGTPGAGMLQTNTLYLFVSLMSICTQNIKIKYYFVQEILRIKKYSYLIGWEHTRGRPIQN